MLRGYMSFCALIPAHHQPLVRSSSEDRFEYIHKERKFSISTQHPIAKVIFSRILQGDLVLNDYVHTIFIKEQHRIIRLNASQAQIWNSLHNRFQNMPLNPLAPKTINIDPKGLEKDDTFKILRAEQILLRDQELPEGFGQWKQLDLDVLELGLTGTWQNGSPIMI